MSLFKHACTANLLGKKNSVLSGKFLVSGFGLVWRPKSGHVSKGKNYVFPHISRRKFPIQGTQFFLKIKLFPFCDILTAQCHSKLYFCNPNFKMCIWVKWKLLFFISIWSYLVTFLSILHYRGQKYFKIALVLQDEWLAIFTSPANTCACPLKVYAIKNIREKYVIWLLRVILPKALVL